MAKTILNILATSYRATLEEQDDTVVWLTQAMRGNGAHANLLLRGSCVNYGMPDQHSQGLKIGTWQQKNPPDLVRDLKSLNDKGAKIYYVEEDAAHLGLEKTELLNFLHPVSETQLAKLFANYDYVWQW